MVNEGCGTFSSGVSGMSILILSLQTIFGLNSVHFIKMRVETTIITACFATANNRDLPELLVPPAAKCNGNGRSSCIPTNLKNLYVCRFLQCFSFHLDCEL